MPEMRTMGAYEVTLKFNFKLHSDCMDECNIDAIDMAHMRQCVCTRRQV